MISKLRARYGNYYFVALMGIATVISWWINYLYHPLMVRFLTESDFALFESLMSLLNVVVVVFSGFALYITQQLSIHKDDNSYREWLVYRWTRRLAYGSGVMIMLLILLSPWIASYLHLDSIGPVILVALSLLAGGVGIVYGALLQSQHQFEYLSINTVVSAIMRVIVGVVLVYYGFGLYGAVIGVVLSGLISVAISRWMTQRLQLKSTDVHQDEIVSSLKTNRYQIVLFCMAMFAILGMSNLDIMMVQHHFKEQAASYIALSVVAKFLIFLGTALESVYYPQLSRQLLWKHTFAPFRNYMILQLFLIGSAIVWSWLVWSYILDLFKPWLGQEIFFFERLLIVFGMVLLYTTVLKLFVAWKKMTLVWIAVCLAAVLLLLLQFWWGVSVDYFVTLFMVWMAVILCVMWVSILSLVYGSYERSS